MVSSSAYHTYREVRSTRDSRITAFLHGSAAERERYVGDCLGDGRDANLPGERVTPNTYSSVRLQLHPHHDSMSGTFALDVVLPDGQAPEHLDCDVELIAVCGDFVLLRFAMTRVRANHFGVLFLQISNAGRTLNGYFLKKRVFSKNPKLGLGVFELHRQP